MTEEEKIEDLNKEYKDCALNRSASNCSIFPIAGNGCIGCGHFNP
jgi:hypothetical protein